MMHVLRGPANASHAGGRSNALADVELLDNGLQRIQVFLVGLCLQPHVNSGRTAPLLSARGERHVAVGLAGVDHDHPSGVPEPVGQALALEDPSPVSEGACCSAHAH